MTATTDLDVMQEWAQLYASQGWPVIPLHVPTSFGDKKGDARASCSCNSPKCESQGKHPRTSNGLDDASTDAQVIAQWWKRWPGANIGLVTGVAFDVLDLDGELAMDLLDTAAPLDSEGFAGPVRVTGKGAHYLYKPTGQGNRANLLAKGSGIDWRGKGGYIVAPPSVHYLEGRRYEWAETQGADTPLPLAPRWLEYLVTERAAYPGTEAAKVARVSGNPLNHSEPLPVEHFRGTTRYGAKAVERIAGDLAAATSGHRNHTLNACAYTLGRLIGGHELDETEALAVLWAGAQAIGLDTKEKGEAWYSIRSGLTDGKNNPKRAPRLTIIRGGAKQ